MEFGYEAARSLAGGSFSVGPALLLFHGILMPLVGRVFLACLPPGRPGGHAPRDLPATWAASQLAGLTWFLAIRELVPGDAWPFVAFGIPLVLLAVLALTSPAGLVPRHEPVPLPAAFGPRAAILFTVLATGAWKAGAYGFPIGLVVALTTCAAAILANEALVLARVQPWLRAATLAAICAGITLLPHREGEHEAIAAIGASGIAAGIVGWIRRGDRRALAIATIGIAYLVVARVGGAAGGIAIVVPIAATLGTAKRSRWRTLAWLVGGLIASSIVLRIGAHPTPAKYIARTNLGVGVEMTLLALTVSALWATYLLRIHRPTPAWNPSGAPESREARVLGIAAVVTICLSHVLSCRISDASEHSGYPANSPAALPTWIFLLVAVAIPLARTLDRTRTA